jgi:hypothetical protein
LVCLVAALIPTLTMAWAANYLSQEAYHALTEKSLKAFQKGVKFIVSLEADTITLQATQLMASPPAVALAAGADDEATKALTDLVAKEPNIDYLVILDPKGVANFSYFGPNAPEGLTAADLRPVKPSRAASFNASFQGVLDLAMSGPLKDSGGQIVGQMVLGHFVFQDEFMDDIKSIFATDFTVFLGDVRAATTLVRNGKRSVGTKMDNQRVLQTVLRDGGDFVNQNIILGQLYDTIYWPLLDNDEKPMGMFYLGQPATLANQTQKRFLTSLAIIIAIVTVLVLIASKLVVGSISRVMSKIVNELDTNFEKVSHSASDMLSSSESLADGSEAQAASLQEAIAALENMTNLASQCLENAGKTKASNEDTNRHITQGGHLTGEMMNAMSQIEASTIKIEAIIKTIDDISFQTNLLALNAAVEAARAGEAGAGFAVVAEEVRNLSLRSTEAAKNIHDLITTSVSKVAAGVKIVRQLDDCFQKIQTGAQNVSALIDQIAGATEEQAKGTHLAESSVESVSEVADRNSQQAKITTESSRDLNQAAESLNHVISDLSAILEGKKGNGRAKAALPPGSDY